MSPVAGFAIRVTCLNSMVSFFITRNTQIVTRDIILQRKNNMLAEIINKLTI